MATATFGPQGKTRALNSIRDGGYSMTYLMMNTIHPTLSTPDPGMSRIIKWGTNAGYARSTNVLKPKTSESGSEFDDALLFPIAAGRKFSNMTLHLADSGLPLMLTFELQGANSATVSSYGTAKLVGAITINF